MKEALIKELIIKASEARKFSYAPYSKYCVGAALMSNEERIYTGCNIENASYGATNCAERTAFFKAISEGNKDFCAIAIVGGPADEKEENSFSEYAFPCGVCRQVMQEFCSQDFCIIVAKSVEDYKVFTLKDLLPYGFGGNLKEEEV